MLIARTLLISGRVQGVGFRYFTRDVATREGVTGWVRNLADGRVQAYLEGEAEAVTRVERLVRRGPGGSVLGTSTRTSNVAIKSPDAVTGRWRGICGAATYA